MIRVLGRERRQGGALLADQPEGEIDVAEGGPGGEHLAGADQHPAFVQFHPGVALAEQRRQPPGGGCRLPVENARFGQDEGADAGGPQLAATPGVRPQHGRAFAHIRPLQRLQQGLGHPGGQGRHHDPVRRRPRRQGLDRHGQPLRGADPPAQAGHGHLESQVHQALHGGQVVGRREGVLQNRQARIENPIEDEQHDAHGRIPSKVVTIANMTGRPPGRKVVRGPCAGPTPGVNHAFRCP